MYTKILKCIQFIEIKKLRNVYNLNARPNMYTILKHTNRVKCIQIVRTFCKLYNCLLKYSSYSVIVTPELLKKKVTITDKR
jgi:hypothetical protein